MKVILATSDPVLLGFATSILKGAGLTCHILDTHMSIMEGSIGIFPQRLVVGDDELMQARRLLGEVGLADELCD